MNKNKNFEKLFIKRSLFGQRTMGEAATAKPSFNLRLLNIFY